MANKFKTVSLDTMIDKHIGKRGAERREVLIPFPPGVSPPKLDTKQIIFYSNFFLSCTADSGFR